MIPEALIYMSPARRCRCYGWMKLIYQIKKMAPPPPRSPWLPSKAGEKEGRRERQLQQTCLSFTTTAAVHSAQMENLPLLPNVPSVCQGSTWCSPARTGCLGEACRPQPGTPWMCLDTRRQHSNFHQSWHCKLSLVQKNLFLPQNMWSWTELPVLRTRLLLTIKHPSHRMFQRTYEPHRCSWQRRIP